MRQATYSAEGKAGPAEVAVYYFGPGQGGDPETNVQRWIGQFQDVPGGGVTRSEEEINGFSSIHVNVESGTFSSGMPGGPSGPQKEWGMSASIVQTKEGPYFFKMTGPSATVLEQKDNFAQLLASITAKKK